ncbi:MAG: DUF4175 family protein, partial [Gemmataceae bacterium]
TGSRRLVWLGAALGVLVLVLGGLFLLVKGSQFSSLVSRAVNPFANTAIASRTRIDLLEPAGGNATVTDGEQLNVAISIGGRLPDAAGPEKPRLLVRHNPDSAEYDEFPLVRGDGSRDFSLMVPRSVIQNGFWYRVAAGDGLTPEYRVDVRTRPMVNGFRAEYEYPAYLKWPADVGTDARVRCPRGTSVTLTVQTNREVKSGTLRVTTGPRQQVETILGEVSGEKNGSLRFHFKLQEGGTYRVHFVPAGGEPAYFSPDYPLDIEIDHPPAVTITSPKEEEITLPPNGRLAIDAEITDDHGVRWAGAVVKFQSTDGKYEILSPWKSDPASDKYRREKDGTYPTEVTDFKESVKLDTLVLLDEKGRRLERRVKEGDVLEYWVYARDNCEPVNNGQSKVKRVRVVAAPPAPTPEQQKQLQQKEQQRKADEQKAQQQQQERKKNDTRPPDQARNPDPDKQPNQPQDQNKQGEPTGDPMKGGEPQKGGEAGNKDDKNPMGSGQQGNDPTGKPDPGTKPDPNQKQDSKAQPDGSPDQKGGDKPDDKKQQQQAQDLQDKINEKKGEPGDAKGDGTNAPQSQETKPVGENKPGEKGSPQGNDKSAAEPKGGDPTEQPGPPPPAQSKDGGTLTQPERSADKEGPKEGAQGDQQPAGEQPKSPPKDGAEAGTSKGSNPEQGGQPNDPGELDRENGGSKPQEKLDKLAGKEHRDTVERLNRDLNSGDPKRQEQAKKEIDELAKKHQDELAKKNQGNDKQDAAGGAKGAEPQPKPGDKQDQQPGPQQGGGKHDKSDAKHPDDLSGAKGSGDPTRGDTKKEEKQPQGRGGSDTKDSTAEQQPGAAEAKGEKPMDPAASKDGKADPKGGNQPGQKQNDPPPDAGQEKGPPKDDSTDPMGKG